MKGPTKNPIHFSEDLCAPLTRLERTNLDEVIYSLFFDGLIMSIKPNVATYCPDSHSSGIHILVN